ncbi:hypothetical protein HPB52_001759 [Rhipicephalus sanguineus]|uniref:Uncharacterized protein n=1 Tax=Rhipicephalus sanguineus TaxID=34632 RepID=A0A9D4QI08_RHISA|nr:hypothetical protein HPB52_001759 [Rhipicephalus sanguineus]
MFRSTSSGAELLWQSQSEASLVHQLRKPRTTVVVAASGLFLVLLLVAIGVALRPRKESQPDFDVLHPAIARLFTANFSIDTIGDEGGSGVASVDSARLPMPLLAFGKRDSNSSALRRPEKVMEELDKL